MNILIINTGVIEQKLIKLCLQSKMLHKIYTASSEPLEDIPNIEYSDWEDLVRKAKSLQIDIALVADKDLIKEGFVDYCKKKYLNVISANQKWFNLESSRLIAKQLLNYYSINTPEIIKVPITFPVVIKTDKREVTKVAYSMNDLVEIREEMTHKNSFLEEYLQGDVVYLLSLWDGKNLIHFNPNYSMSEVQIDRLDLLKTKINFMYSDEKPDFIGFFITKIIWAKNDWYVLDFTMHLDETFDLNLLKQDFIYLLNAVIYQKLEEI